MHIYIHTQVHVCINCVYIYIYTHICIYIYTHIYIYIHTHIYICTYIDIYTHIYIYIYLYAIQTIDHISVCVCVCVHACVHACVCACVCVCVYGHVSGLTPWQHVWSNHHKDYEYISILFWHVLDIFHYSYFIKLKVGYSVTLLYWDFIAGWLSFFGTIFLLTLATCEREHNM